MKCYNDGSFGEDDNGHKWITLATYIGSDGFWGNFERKWHAMLLDRYPVAPFIHMIDLLGWDDPFERVNGWDEDKRDKLIQDALELLDGLSKSSYRSFVASVDITAREYLTAEGFDIPESIPFCAKWCFQQSFDWYLHAHPNKWKRAIAYYDRGEQFLAVVRDVWLERRSPPGKSVLKGDFWDLIENIIPIDMPFTPGVQAADMLAWAQTRGLSPKDRLYRDLAKAQRLIIPQTSVVMDEATMRQQYTPRS